MIINERLEEAKKAFKPHGHQEIKTHAVKRLTGLGISLKAYSKFLTLYFTFLELYYFLLKANVVG